MPFFGQRARMMSSFSWNTVLVSETTFLLLYFWASQVIFWFSEFSRPLFDQKTEQQDSVLYFANSKVFKGEKGGKRWRPIWTFLSSGTYGVKSRNCGNGWEKSKRWMYTTIGDRFVLNNFVSLEFLHSSSWISLMSDGADRFPNRTIDDRCIGVRFPSLKLPEVYWNQNKQTL